MPGSKKDFPLVDNGGRRLGIDSRQFSYNAHIPERRNGKDRRSGEDERSGEDRRKVNDLTVSMDRRSGIERRTAFR